MAELDELVDLLEEDSCEEEAEEDKVDQDEAELQAMLAKVEAMKAKVAAKKKALTPVDMFQKAPEPSPASPFLEKPNKPIKLHEKTPAFGPAVPQKTSRVIQGKEKEELLARISGSSRDQVRGDLELSSDEEEEKGARRVEAVVSEKQDSRQISSFLGESKKRKGAFNDIQGSSLNLSNPSQNKALPSNILLEKNSKIRINNPKVTQAQLDLNLIDRTFISIFRLQASISRKETEGRDWSTMGIIFYKNVQTSKNGNTYTMWKLSDLAGGGEPTVISVMLFGRAHAVHYKMPNNKVVGILNPKVLESRDGGGSSATLSVDHPDKIMEMGDGLDMGRCKGNKHDGSPCNSIVNAALSEFCTYHIKKAYKSMSSKRADLQSSFSGPSNPRSRIMSKIAPKGEIFGGGQVLNGDCKAARVNPKHQVRDANALRTLGVLPGEGKAEAAKFRALSRQNILSEANSSVLMSSSQKKAMVKALDEGVSEDLVSKLLSPSPGARVLLKHMTRNVEVKEEKEAVAKGDVKTAKSLLADHRNKLKTEALARKAIEDRKKLAQINIASVPKLGKGSQDGFIDLGSPSPSNGSKAKALLALKGKGIPKVNPNNVKRKRLPEESLQCSKEKVAKVLSHSEQRAAGNVSVPERPVLRGINGSLMDEAKLEALKKMKSVNADLAEEAESDQREKYFDVLEKKDAMEEQMVDTKEIQVRAVSCTECGYTAYAQSELCKEQRHAVKVTSAKKRFYACAKCGNRTTSLDKYPKTTCDKCGNSGWKRAGMMKEKKAVLEHEKLVIRGLEEKFIGSHTSKTDLDSIV